VPWRSQPPRLGRETLLASSECLSPTDPPKALPHSPTPWHRSRSSATKAAEARESPSARGRRESLKQSDSLVLSGGLGPSQSNAATLLGSAEDFDRQSAAWRRVVTARPQLLNVHPGGNKCRPVSSRELPEAPLHRAGLLFCATRSPTGVSPTGGLLPALGGAGRRQRSGVTDAAHSTRAQGG
jgi:hypothetical protein